MSYGEHQESHNVELSTHSTFKTWYRTRANTSLNSDRSRKETKFLYLRITVYKYYCYHHHHHRHHHHLSAIEVGFINLKPLFIFLFCLVQQVVPSNWIPSNYTQTFNGTKTDLFAIECHLPSPPINLANFDEEGTVAAGYVVSVSNDGTHQSKLLKMITFDSVCQMCKIEQGCSLKVKYI